MGDGLGDPFDVSRSSYKNSSSPGDYFIELFMLGAMLFILGFFALLTLSFIANSDPPVDQSTVRTEVVDRTELLAFGDNIGVEGSFFLGTGSVQSTPYYFYYYRTAQNRIKMGKERAEYAYIEEWDKSRQGVLVKQITVGEISKEWKENSFLGNFVIDDEEVLDSKTIFKIPKGSVVRQFKADLN